jgi:drug/metabolite transporter (DMT)-like permease
MKVFHSQYFRSEALLFLTAIIWGFAFVAQRVGMEYIGPFTFNSIRFALGSLALIPFIHYRNSRKIKSGKRVTKANVLSPWKAGTIAGVVLFCGATLQQTGIVYTTAGKAGFITGLYVIFVPLIGIFRQQRTGKLLWVGATVALSGMYFLSISHSFRPAPGDLLVFLSAFFWAVHVQVIHHYSGRVDVLKLAVVQFGVCSLASLAFAVLMETISLNSILRAAVPILYGGLLSVGIAYTLQIFAQQKAHPSHAAIILSLETVFAALGGWLILGELLSARAVVGCALMLSGMLLAQMSGRKKSGVG